MSTPSRQPKPDTTDAGSDATRRPPQELTPAAKQWLEENAEAIKSINEWVEKHGLPLEKYRLF
jgi:hypothetical protein